MQMFDFQAHRTEPVRLLEILERFTNWWFHAPPGEQTGVSAERLALVSIPAPLKRLYSFAGEWPGGAFDCIFSHQDYLAPFEWLESRRGKLIFAHENQGVWALATDTEGIDPPVYLSIDDGPFEQFSDSLSQFLVTFCLHECVFGAPCVARVDNLCDLNRSHGKVPIPIWLNAPYPSAVREGNTVSFYLVDGSILQMDCWCGGHRGDLDESYPDYFPQNKSHRPKQTSSDREIWDVPEVPRFIKTTHVEQLIRKHQRISKSHMEKASYYQKILKKIQGEAPQ